MTFENFVDISVQYCVEGISPRSEVFLIIEGSLRDVGQICRRKRFGNRGYLISGRIGIRPRVATSSSSHYSIVGVHVAGGAALQGSCWWDQNKNEGGNVIICSFLDVRVACVICLTGLFERLR